MAIASPSLFNPIKVQHVVFPDVPLNETEPTSQPGSNLPLCTEDLEPAFEDFKVEELKMATTEQLTTELEVLLSINPLMCQRYHSPISGMENYVIHDVEVEKSLLIP